MAITVTEKAASRIRQIINDQQQSAAAGPEKFPEKVFLRLRVVGGGCSGFQHKLDLDPQVDQQRDEVLEINGVPVVVDKRSKFYLENVTVDYHDDLNRPGFSIHNPTAKSTCGCGSSFSM